MAILGHLIARSIKLQKKFHLPVATPIAYQRHVIRQLLERGQYTAFGKHYGFGEILSKEFDFVSAFRNTVPICTYREMNNEWWYRCHEGEENVCWPGKVKYFALSSGTSDASSKHIPVTQDMIKSIKKVGFKQIFSLTNFSIPPQVLEKGILMLGGTTTLMEKGEYYEGDMSGISAKNMPRWMSSLLYKPGQKISKKIKWEDRINSIIEKADRWDVGIICGVPAWVEIVLERIIKRYGVNTIHDIWPNLTIYIHGGVSIEPYRVGLNKLFSKQVVFIETYMASEGSFGFQVKPGAGIKLVLNVGVFFEFLPFNSENFDEDGNITNTHAKTYLINEVKEGTEYAVVLSTCAGTWRYVIGDVLRFTNAKEHEIAIVGRTKQFLSLCGEHLSIDNMNKAIEVLAKKMGITIREFTVAGYKLENRFVHQWYIGCDDTNIDLEKLTQILDRTLCELNDDYEVERLSALKEIFVEILPTNTFFDYLRQIGKEGAMNKFPRVLKNGRLTDWENYLAGRKG